ncbi:homoserine kinase [Buchnera aphidicola (Nipponaphis monzeni)]|uniref:Homoserine kinase n=1 Tax=Buchnera aphidicola (Nipponaphis monzeni) TaxID=2495405 RepID=A0A455TA24_9GAMM|nr:homoserine kinase [Buchnera aphidicola]BBI01173.1 homoserine kinase [Buchnera aphidicola (Nipponaphis monzeni)]
MIKVYAPASIGNVGVGFDILGAAILPTDGTLLGDLIQIKQSKEFQLTNIGTFAHQLPKNIKDNIVWKCWDQFCKIIKKKILVTIVLEKNMPIGSGLGSSACSIVSSLFAMNELCNRPLSTNKLLKLMGKLEGEISGSIHYDNVSPCYLGGLQLIIEKNNKISQKIPNFKNWLWIIAWPGIKISTADARALLPSQYTRTTCIKHSRNLSGFIHASYTMQPKLAANFITDVIAEPYRSKLLPNFTQTKTTIKKIGALACGISGSGPSIFAICDNDLTAKKISKYLANHYIQSKQGFVQVCKLDTVGTRIIG